MAKPTNLIQIQHHKRLYALMQEAGATVSEIAEEMGMEYRKCYTMLRQRYRGERIIAAENALCRIIERKNAPDSKVKALQAEYGMIIKKEGTALEIAREMYAKGLIKIANANTLRAIIKKGNIQEMEAILAIARGIHKAQKAEYEKRRQMILERPYTPRPKKPKPQQEAERDDSPTRFIWETEYKATQGFNPILHHRNHYP